jgi:hypothetical protein
MGKAAGAVAMIFMVGSGAVSFLGGFVGVHAEAAALALVGLGLVATGQAIGSARHFVAPKPHEAR